MRLGSGMQDAADAPLISFGLDSDLDPIPGEILLPTPSLGRRIITELQQQYTRRQTDELAALTALLGELPAPAYCSASEARWRSVLQKRRRLVHADLQELVGSMDELDGC